MFSSPLIFIISITAMPLQTLLYQALQARLNENDIEHFKMSLYI